MALNLFLFYIFSLVLVGSSIAAISSRNMVHNVLFLILAFFNAAALFVLIGAEFIAMLLVIVYVGAIAVLFLFVVMMLNVDAKEIKQKFNVKTASLAAFSLIIFTELLLIIKASLAKDHQKFKLFPIDNKISNAEAIGLSLYTEYFIAFQLAGAVLFVAMIGAIVLTLTKNNRFIRRQKISNQVLRNKKESIEIVKVQTGQGINI